MMNEKLRQLRMKHKMTQEMLAEQLGVSRQTVAKWENGESTPDVVRCSELAAVFGLELADIARIFLPENPEDDGRPVGKYIFGRCILTDNKIVIPDAAMQVFGLQEGDELILVGDVKQGLALFPSKRVNDFVKEFQNAPKLEVDRYENSH